MQSISYLLEQRRTGRQLPCCTGLLVSRLGPLRGSEILGTCNTSVSFCPDDEGRPKLVVGDEASRLQLWCPNYSGGGLATSFDTVTSRLFGLRLQPCKQRFGLSVTQGHTGSILCARFLMGSSGSKLISCSTDRQVRFGLLKSPSDALPCRNAAIRGPSLGDTAFLPPLTQ